mmetsp:Transcript_34166/g.97058  ORF Transcript_34166/g.97058 Transcript_34166/m.97058 type:complete len:235 (+) Transcript_34166:369-1073(+)
MQRMGRQRARAHASRVPQVGCPSASTAEEEASSGRTRDGASSGPHIVRAYRAAVRPVDAHTARAASDRGPTAQKARGDSERQLVEQLARSSQRSPSFCVTDAVKRCERSTARTSPFFAARAAASCGERPPAVSSSPSRAAAAARKASATRPPVLPTSAERRLATRTASLTSFNVRAASALRCAMGRLGLGVAAAGGDGDAAALPKEVRGPPERTALPPRAAARFMQGITATGER